MNINKTQIVAILFSDIKGYSKLGDENKHHIYEFNDKMEEKAKESDSFIFFKSLGDGLLIIMDSVIEIVEFALNLRDNVKRTN